MTAPATTDLHAIFPTPVQRIAGLISPAQAQALRERLSVHTPVANDRSAVLTHTALLSPGDDPAVHELAARLLPAVAAFGTVLLGEPLRWSIKEMWANVMPNGGHQSLHNHANCMISGVVYLSPTEGRTQTVFVKSLGGQDFKFSNQHEGTQTNAFNASRWVAPPAEAGDAILFPSYLLHEVPPNQGDVRVSLAFNAIPERLNAWGYRVSLDG